jgi:anthranilate phosphoribosyltransferase
VRIYQVTPEDFGLERAPLEAISGGDAAQNASLIRAILSGESGPRRDIVVVNAAAAIVASGRAIDFLEGAHLAATSIDSGEALRKLELLIAFAAK